MRSAKRNIFLAVIIFLPVFHISGYEDTSNLKFLEDKTFTVNISIRLISEEQVNIWNTESSKITISGRAVNVKLYGEDILINADITPYLKEDNTILLVAQGEFWISSREEEGVNYYTTMQSLPVESGEKIIFFPLGLALDSESNIYTIELEIQVMPYREIVKENDIR